jgi:hypothetical protein
MQVATMTVLAKFALGYRWSTVLPGIFLGVAIFAGILDQLYLPFVIKIIPIEVILSNTWIRILVSMPQQAAMLIIILLCYRYNFKIFDITVFKEGM